MVGPPGKDRQGAWLPSGRLLEEWFSGKPCSFRRVRFQTIFKINKVMTAQGLHLFPFLPEKLNLATPMVLRKRESR